MRPLIASFLIAIIGASIPPPAQEPPNLSKCIDQIVRYHDSGAWNRDIDRVVSRADAYLLARYKKVAKPAIVLDIDETSLSNWEEEKRTNFGYVPKLWNAWQNEEAATAIPAVLRLYKLAKSHHITVFFVTGRGEDSRTVTAENLEKVGYAGFDALYMKPAKYQNKSIVPFKSSRRAMIERNGFTILVNVGDQLSDLAGGHAERTYKISDPMYFIP